MMWKEESEAQSQQLSKREFMQGTSFCDIFSFLFNACSFEIRIPVIAAPAMRANMPNRESDMSFPNESESTCYRQNGGLRFTTANKKLDTLLTQQNDSRRESGIITKA
jgi:hypothetical protein